MSAAAERARRVLHGQRRELLISVNPEVIAELLDENDRLRAGMQAIADEIATVLEADTPIIRYK